MKTYVLSIIIIFSQASRETIPLRTYLPSIGKQQVEMISRQVPALAMLLRKCDWYGTGKCLVWFAWELQRLKKNTRIIKEKNLMCLMFVLTKDYLIIQFPGRSDLVRRPLKFFISYRMSFAVAVTLNANLHLRHWTVLFYASVLNTTIRYKPGIPTCSITKFINTFCDSHRWGVSVVSSGGSDISGGSIWCSYRRGCLGVLAWSSVQLLARDRTCFKSRRGYLFQEQLELFYTQYAGVFNNPCCKSWW